MSNTIAIRTDDQTVDRLEEAVRLVSQAQDILAAEGFKGMAGMAAELADTVQCVATMADTMPLVRAAGGDA